MKFVIGVVIFLLVIAVIRTLSRKGQPSRQGSDYTPPYQEIPQQRPVYRKREALFSPAERLFFGVLDQAVDSRYRVFGKVRLGDLVQPPSGVSKGEWLTALGGINQKHIDYVLCAAADLTVVGAIELDDQSHEQQDRIERDQLVDSALADAGIPIVRFTVKQGYGIQDIRTALTDRFGVLYEEIIDQTPTAAFKAEETPPACPICNVPMVKRQSKQEGRKGDMFWGCSAYPDCRQTLKIASTTT